MSLLEIFEDFKTKFHINADLEDVEVKKITAEPYQSTDNHTFGEKVCLLHEIGVKIFHFHVSLKVLSFFYETHPEVLKLDIQIHHKMLTSEIKACRNFLQRRRNLNAMFETMVKFIKLFEMRRIISRTLFEKYDFVITKPEEGLNVQCEKPKSTHNLMDCKWRIVYHVDTNQVTDFIEFCVNDSVVDEEVVYRVKATFERLVLIDFDFHTKLKFWKLILGLLYVERPLDEVLVISDNEDDVIEIRDDSQSDCQIVN